MLTFCHFLVLTTLSLSVTFRVKISTNFWEVLQTSFVHTNATARHHDIAAGDAGSTGAVLVPVTVTTTAVLAA
jgi:hypothetical protein